MMCSTSTSYFPTASAAGQPVSVEAVGFMKVTFAIASVQITAKPW
jgi:hypothetical protein